MFKERLETFANYPKNSTFKNKNLTKNSKRAKKERKLPVKFLRQQFLQLAAKLFTLNDIS